MMFKRCILQEREKFREKNKNENFLFDFIDIFEQALTMVYSTWAVCCHKQNHDDKRYKHNGHFS